MARRCVCAALIDRLRTDPRLRVLPLAARALWLELVVGLAEFGAQGRIRFTQPVSVSVSRCVSASETETETQLHALVGAGLLVLDDDGLGVCSPDLAAALTRVEINRINGLKGGRPRKPRPAAPAQREILLPIPGGAKTEKTETETQPSRARADEESLSLSLSERHQISSDAPEWVSVGFELARILDLPETAHWSLRPVARWMAAGADRRLLVEIATELKARAPGPIGSIRYMQRAVDEALSGRPDPLAESRAREALRARQKWLEGGCVGPSPLLSLRGAA
ncbi:MAG: hypothetical protein N2688_00010 [Burkholderiaceae bacterium]|nr:hypothetical protein [Burkholderiaceae bacterium]